ncbi:Hpt domain-containing protein [Aureimonas sp. AU4]|uniref:Hpt domain-containing protein n=1 Tax=Aureimonas sp. AU4 TaxID=1638163 RepID=UPI0007848D53|nr:Hpt domain-containing protein [Aureimonas sp. AU4]
MTATQIQAAPSLCPSRERPIDLVHLARQTGGSQSLELEVLGIMARQIGDALAISTEPDPRTNLRSLAHALCGAARNMGAFPLARAARQLEAQPADREALDGFRRELSRALVFIRALTLMEDRVDGGGRAH